MSKNQPPQPAEEPMSEHQRWAIKAYDIQLRINFFKEACERLGINPDEDPDYNFMLGQLSVAQSELIGHTALAASDAIEAFLQAPDQES